MGQVSQQARTTGFKTCPFLFPSTARMLPGCSFRQSFTLPVHCVPGWVLCQNHLACRGRASETNRAPQRADAMVQAAFTGSPCTSPVAAISLSVALWKETAVVPTPSVPQPRTGRVGQVFRRSPRVVDVQSTVQSWRGFGIITATSDQAFTRILLTVLLQKTAHLPRGLRFSHV